MTAIMEATKEMRSYEQVQLTTRKHEITSNVVFYPIGVNLSDLGMFGK
jgi:hypothetical protein